MLTPEEYRNMMDKMPIPCIDLAMDFPEGLLWIRRDNHPYRGYWAMPGGRIFKYETMDEAIDRIARKETGLDVSRRPRKLLGLYSVVNSMEPNLIRHDITSLYSLDLTENFSDVLLASKMRPDRSQVQDVKFTNEMPEPIGELHIWEYNDMKKAGLI